MRELTKSMLRMSWALPLFGIKQMTHLALPTKANQERVCEAFDALSDAAQRELGSAFEGLYDAGDGLQKGMVDATFGVFMLDLFDPGRWMPGRLRPPAARRPPPPRTPRRRAVRPRAGGQYPRRVTGVVEGRCRLEDTASSGQSNFRKPVAPTFRRATRRRRAQSWQTRT